MANKVNWTICEQSLTKHGARLFSPRELQRVMGVSPVAARFLVHRYARRGGLLKLRNGLYALASRPPSELAIANRLYEPSYISFEFALAHHHLVPESVYVITSATSRPTRTFTVAERTFEYHRLKPTLFTGYEPVTIQEELVLMATPEKALLDYLYFVDLRKKILNGRLSLRAIRWARVNQLVTLFGRPSLARLVRGLR